MDRVLLAVFLGCGTPEQPLLKVISPALEASPDALRFATVFDLRQELIEVIS